LGFKGLSQRKQSTSLYQWMLETQIPSARVKMGVSTACLLVSCEVHNGDTTSHQLPQSDI